MILSKPWLDTFLAMNGYDAVKNTLDDGDCYISNVLMKNSNIFWKDVFNSCYKNNRI
jgi:hypothetical protein